MPPANTVNWSSTATWQKLVAAIVATGVKACLHLGPSYPRQIRDSISIFPRYVATNLTARSQLDLHEVAKMYGTTYDTIQNRYRKIRAEANEIKQHVESGESPEIVVTPKRARAAGTGTPRKAKGGKDALSTVTNARVTKSSPNKKNAVKQEKKDEAKEGAEEDIFYGVDFSADFGDVGMDDGELAF